MEENNLVSGIDGREKSVDLPQSVIQIIEEQINVTSKIVETGKVKISKKVSKENYHADIPVFKEEVIVERRPVNKFIEDEGVGIRLDGDTTIIPVIKEIIVKRLLLVEEIYITKKRSEHTVAIDETLRKEEVFVERSESPVPDDQQLSQK